MLDVGSQRLASASVPVDGPSSNCITKLNSMSSASRKFRRRLRSFMVASCQIGSSQNVPLMHTDPNPSCEVFLGTRPRQKALQLDVQGFFGSKQLVLRSQQTTRFHSIVTFVQHVVPDFLRVFLELSSACAWRRSLCPTTLHPFLQRHASHLHHRSRSQQS